MSRVKEGKNMDMKEKMRTRYIFTIIFVVICFCGIISNRLFFRQSSDNKPVEEISGDYQFVLNRDNTLTITKYLGSERLVEIPAEIDGKAVTAIGTTLGQGAFQDCSKIVRVTIPEGVTEIQSKAFYGCSNLSLVYISASVQRLDRQAFAGSCNLRSVYFEGDSPEMGEDVFTPTPKLKICHYESAAGWTNPWYGYSSEVYGDYLYEENGDGTVAITGYQGDGCMEIPSVIGGKRVTAIADAENMSFDRRQHVIEITISDGVTEICDNSFNGYTKLETVTIPASVSVLGNNLFVNCPNLKSIYFEGNAPKTKRQVFETTMQTTIYFHEVAEGWTNPWKGLLAETYGDYQYEITDDSTVKITKYVGVGGDVQIPPEIAGKIVTAIGVNSFLNCSALTSVMIPEGVVEIGDNAFSGCCNLKTVVVPASVTIIWHCAFSGCCNLQSVYFEGDAPHMGNYIFDDSEPIFYYYEDMAGWADTWYGRSALKRLAK